MVSSAKLQANRSNARASTGPRTRAGKSVSCKNALRHGLNVPLGLDAIVAAEIELLQRQIFVGSEPSVQGLARDVAIAQLELRRIYQVRDYLSAQYFSNARQLESKGSAESTLDFDKIAKRIVSLTRYEHRALSRLISTVSAFDRAASYQD